MTSEPAHAAKPAMSILLHAERLFRGVAGARRWAMAML